MSQNPLESNHQHTERAQSFESTRQNLAEVASSAYGVGASATDLRGSAGSTAEQHLNKATISKDAIEFGASRTSVGQAGARDSEPDVRRFTDAQGAQVYQLRKPDGSLAEESITNKDGSGTARQYRPDGSRKETNWDGRGGSNSAEYDANNKVVGRSQR